MSDFAPVASTRMKDQPGNEDWLMEFAANEMEKIKEAASDLAVIDKEKAPLAGTSSTDPLTVTPSTPDPEPETEPVMDAEFTSTPENALSSEVARELSEMASLVQDEVAGILQIDADSLAELSKSDQRFQTIHSYFSKLQGVASGFANTLATMGETVASPTATIASKSDKIITAAGLFDRIKGAWEGFLKGKSKAERQKIANAAYAELQQKIQTIVGILAALANRISMLKKKTSAEEADPNVVDAINGLDAEFDKLQNSVNEVADILKVPSKVPDPVEAVGKTDAPEGETPSGLADATDTAVVESPEAAATAPVAPNDPAGTNVQYPAPGGGTESGSLVAPPAGGYAQVMPSGGGAPIHIEIKDLVKNTNTNTQIQGEGADKVEMTFELLITKLEEAINADAKAKEITPEELVAIEGFTDLKKAAIDAINALKVGIAKPVAPEAPAPAVPPSATPASSGSQLDEPEGMTATVTQLDEEKYKGGMKAKVTKGDEGEIVEFEL